MVAPNAGDTTTARQSVQAWHARLIRNGRGGDENTSGGGLDQTPKAPQRLTGVIRGGRAAHVRLTYCNGAGSEMASRTSPVVRSESRRDRSPSVTIPISLSSRSFTIS